MAKLQFEPRGQQMNRIEAVSDVVFGFALTLLVVSLQPPHTYSDLINVMSGFPAFALTFAVLMAVWARHYYFFRYYGLDDPATIVLNTLLLFIVLFYVYPLKFFVSVFLANVWLRPLIGGPMQIRDVPGGPGTLMVWGDQRGLVMIFAVGVRGDLLRFRGDVLACLPDARGASPERVRDRAHHDLDSLTDA